ncbi:hypothetical protein Q4520_17675 [Alteromonas sp. 1_MG-2023]|uniref:hypothetical protein n=1 Tax=Alteromonas sp. 1_MG-2023 TaxID=3062669 RepID=UPI0026E35F4D|nr:hypothetical protein [Alteromonas sp. 1_MG-2023]MDO6477254.1 hypothetical protein [Alteromonas sp. 1_MG-2023]
MNPKESVKESLFNKHFGAIITGTVSLCAVMVSFTQVWVASIDKEKELELLRLTAEESRYLEERKSERKWQLDLANFMAKYRKEIFTPSKERFDFQKIMLATFPKEITLHAFGNLSEINDLNSDYWSKPEYRVLDLYTPRAKIYYEEGFPNVFQHIMDTIGEGEIEYNYSDQEIPKGLTTGDVRYFHESDENLARQVLKEFTQFVCFEANVDIELKLIPLTNSKLRSPRGSVEIWLSSENLKDRQSNIDC